MRSSIWSSRIAGAVGLVVSVVLLAIPTGVASARSVTHKTKHQTCLTMFSTARMSGYSTVRMKLVGGVTKDSVTQPWEYNDNAADQLTVTGTVCVYANSGPDPAGWPRGYDAVVGLGFNAKASHWGAFTATYRAGLGWFDGHMNFGPTYSALKLGHGSKAFLLTFNLWNFYPGFSATNDPGKFPEFYYAVIVLSKHHNVLMFSCEGLSASQTENVARGVLKSGF